MALASPPEAESYDIFIAHAGADTAASIVLYDALAPHCSVFLVERNARPGDDWDLVIPRAQRRSRITAVLVSSHSEKAYYQRVEIAAAIHLARSQPQSHQLIPIILDPAARDPGQLPYGLGPKVTIDTVQEGGMEGVARRLLELLAELNGQRVPEKPVEEPFRLLVPFRREDARLFFGRELAQRALAAMVDEARLVVLHGASGTGKSSLVQAGLRPLLESRYCWVDMAPGPDVGEALARAAGTAAASQGRTVHGPASAALLAASQAAGRPVLLVIDQTEELFQQKSEEQLLASVQALANELRASLTAGAAAGTVHVLLSIRDDYFGQLSYLKQAGLPVFEHELLLRSLDRTGTQRAIEEPLRLAGYRIEPSLVDRIVQDLSANESEVRPVELEIVCQGLLEAARAQKRDRLDVALYDDMGSAGQVLATYLRRALGNIPQASHGAALRVLSRMLGRDGIRLPPVARDELASHIGQPDALTPLLDELVRLRLVEASAVQGEDHTARFRIAHDLVAKEVFDKLSEEEKADLALREKLDIRLREWVQRGRKRLRNSHLTWADRREFLEWSERQAAGSLEQKAFLEEVRRLDRRNGWLLRGAIGGGLVLGLVGILAGLAGVDSYTEALAQRAETRAERELSRDPGRAMAWLHEAVRLRDEVRPEHFYLARQAAQSGVGYQIGTSFGERTSLAFSPPAREGTPCADCWPNRLRLLVGGTSGHLSVYDLKAARWESLLGSLNETSSPIVGSAFLSDGRTVVAVVHDGSLRVWDLSRKRPGTDFPEAILLQRAAPAKSYEQFAMAPGGGQLVAVATGEDRDFLRVWETAGWTYRDYPINGAKRVNQLAFVAGEVLLATSSEGLIGGLVLRTGKWMALEPGFSITDMEQMDSLTVALAGRDLAPMARSQQGAPRLQLLRFEPEGAGFRPVWKEAIRPRSEISEVAAMNETLLISADSSGSLQTWNGSGVVELASTLGSHEGLPTELVVSADRSWVASGGLDGAVLLSDLRNRHIPLTRKLRGHEAGIRNLVFSPDARWLASADALGRVRVWSVIQGLALSANIRKASLKPPPESPPHGASRWLPYEGMEPDEAMVQRNAEWLRAYCAFEHTLARHEARLNDLEGMAGLHDKPLSRKLYLPGCLAGGGIAARYQGGVLIFEGEGAPGRRISREADVTALSVSEDGTQLAVAWADRHVEVWSGTPLTRRTQYTAGDHVKGLAVADDGRTIIAEQSLPVDMLWEYDPQGNKRVPLWRPLPGSVFLQAPVTDAMALSGDGSMLVIGGGGSGLHLSFRGSATSQSIADYTAGQLTGLRWIRGRTLLFSADIGGFGELGAVPLPPHDRTGLEHWLDERAGWDVQIGSEDMPRQTVPLPLLDAANW